MGFQNLRNGNTIYILHRTESPKLEIGKVTNVSPPIPKYGGQFNEMIVDITADVNGTTINFQKVPAMLDITDIGGNSVISCSKGAINDEVRAFKQRSEDILNSMDYHQSVIAGCDDIIKVLNPEIAEKEEREKETQELKNEISSLKSMFGEFMKQFKNQNYGNSN